MDKLALVFSGQGSQSQGMGKEYYERFDIAKTIFNRGSDILGIDLKALCFETDNEMLSMTINSQPAIFTVSLAMASILKEKNVKFEGVCGFSLGEVSALTACEALSIDDGFFTIAKRSKAMQAASEKSDSGMAAVIGLENSVLENICKDVDGYVIPVNYNCPKQLVIAGENSALESAMQAAKQLGAMKVVRLAVNAGFHSKLMADASIDFYNQISEIKGGQPICEIYSAMNAAQMSMQQDIPLYLKEQMTSPVRFEQTILSMIENGYTKFVEVGAGKVLSGLIKRISKDVMIMNFNDLI